MRVNREVISCCDFRDNFHDAVKGSNCRVLQRKQRSSALHEHGENDAQTMVKRWISGNNPRNNYQLEVPPLKPPPSRPDKVAP
jgi:hypothetical protein